MMSNESLTLSPASLTNLENMVTPTSNQLPPPPPIAARDQFKRGSKVKPTRLDFSSNPSSSPGVDETGTGIEDDGVFWNDMPQQYKDSKRAYNEKERERMRQAKNPKDYFEQSARDLENHRCRINLVGWHLMPVICRECHNERSMCFNCLNTVKECTMRLASVVEHYE